MDIDLSIATKYEEFQHPNMEKTGSDINEDLPDEEVGKLHAWLRKIDDEWIRPFLIYKYFIYIRNIK